MAVESNALMDLHTERECDYGNLLNYCKSILQLIWNTLRMSSQPLGRYFVMQRLHNRLAISTNIANPTPTL